eukprot:jgi/Tetstr1/447346/TSEL_034783.t1
MHDASARRSRKKYAAAVEKALAAVARFRPQHRFLFVHTGGFEPFFTSLDVARSTDMTVAQSGTFDEEDYDVFTAVGRILDYGSISRGGFKRLAGAIRNDDFRELEALEAYRKGFRVLDQGGKEVFEFSYLTDAKVDEHAGLVLRKARRILRGLGFSACSL